VIRAVAAAKMFSREVAVAEGMAAHGLSRLVPARIQLIYHVSAVSWSPCPSCSRLQGSWTGQMGSWPCFGASARLGLRETFRVIPRQTSGSASASSTVSIRR
jgi:hypothetical protein